MKTKSIVVATAAGVIFAPASSAETVGTWCDTIIPNMSAHDAIIKIIVEASGRYVLKRRFGDGSSNERELVKSGTKFDANNDFGEYYVIRSDKSLELYDRDGIIRVAKRTANSSQPGRCR